MDGTRISPRGPAVQGAPEPRGEDIVQELSCCIQRDRLTGSAGPIRPGKGGELAALIGVHDVGWTELVGRIVQRFNAGVGPQAVSDPLGQDLASVPVHHWHQVENPKPHEQVGR